MNSLFVIHPNKYRGSWVFDDAAVGLDREPFVAGADDIMERLWPGNLGCGGEGTSASPAACSGDRGRGGYE